MKRNKGPNNDLNRAMQHIRRACEDLHHYKSSFPQEIAAQRNSMFKEDFKTLASYETADVACHLLQYVRRQLGSIKVTDWKEKQ